MILIEVPEVVDTITAAEDPLVIWAAGALVPVFREMVVADLTDVDVAVVGDDVWGLADAAGSAVEVGAADEVGDDGTALDWVAAVVVDVVDPILTSLSVVSAVVLDAVDPIFSSLSVFSAVVWLIDEAKDVDVDDGESVSFFEMSSGESGPSGLSFGGVVVLESSLRTRSGSILIGEGRRR